MFGLFDYWISKDKPIFYFTIDNIIIDITWENESNLIHRENGPACITFNKETGNMIQMRFFINDEYNNKNGGPTTILFNINGSIRYIEYINNKQFHNLNGSARIWYNHSGIYIRDYYINGIKYDSKKEYLLALKHLCLS